MDKKFKKVAEDYRQVKFEKGGDSFCGVYKRTEHIVPNEKDPFDILIFVDIETGEFCSLPSNYTIAHTIAKLKDSGEDFENTVIAIEFKGKTVLNGKPFSKFDIGILSLDEFNGKEVKEQAVKTNPSIKGKKK